MTIPYLPRLFCASMAAFFLVHLALGLAVALLSPAAVRMARRMSPRASARFLLTVRLFPAGFGLFAVAAVCIPSYCRLEPAATAERVSVECLAAAFLGAAIWAIALARAWRAAARTLEYVRGCERSGRMVGWRADVWLVETAAPVLALARILKPRVLISRCVVDALAMDELGAVLDHERAHRTSRDNAKRLALLLAPGLVPFANGFGALEREWERASEWAADDCAVGGNPLRSVSLAGALVTVARMRMQAPSALMSSFVDGRDFAERVDRLLAEPPVCEAPRRKTGAVLTALGVAAGVSAGMLQAGTFASVYGLMEKLVH